MIMQVSALANKLKSQLIKDSALQFILSTSASLLAFIQIPLLINSLSLSGFGYIVLAQTVGAIWGTFTIAQLHQGLLSFAPNNSKSASIISWSIRASIVNFIVSTALLALVAGSAIYNINDSILPTSKSDALTIIPLAISTIIANSPLLGAIYRIENRYQEFMLYQLVTATARLLIIYIAAQSGLGIWFISMAAFLAPDLIKIMILHWRSRPQKSLSDLPKSERWKILKFSITMNITAAADLPAQQLDKIILLPFIGIANVGIYQSIKRVGLIISMVTSPFANSLFHEYSKLVNSGAPQKAIRLFHLSLAPFFIATTTFSLALSQTKEIWLPRFLPGAELEVTLLSHVLIIYCIASAFIGLHSLLYALRKLKAALCATLVSNAIFLIGAAILVPTYQMQGIIYSLALQVASILLIKYYVIRRSLR
ncbi:lipopolysaccharide biosynthesis protein [Pseudomonas sp. CR3202]|uniref:lipopolysaccharide biosynthesis protein n=1 Tax=Pseudomonas sp. CR3202 TaxID=3351532 RepID=UPI003BF0FC3C